MKYSYNWLKEISGTKKSAEELAKILTMHSFELDGIEIKGDGLENIVVGEILDIQKHPNADRLQLTKIDIGSKELNIVCGANNIKVGDKILYGKYSGTEVTIDNEEYLIMRESDIYAII